VSTVVSSSTSYADADDLVLAHDVNKICHYASDAGVSLTPGDLPTNSVVSAALLRASGEVEMACYRGEKYTPTDLESLTGASQAALKGLVCDLAFYHLAKRRIPEPEKVSGYKEARETLASLIKGDLVFGIQESARAGQMSTIDISARSDGISNRPTEVFSRFFGNRSDNWTRNPLTGSN
jgi:phage gp36-like protein